MTDDRVQRWLESLGFHPEPEPDWIAQGLKPDFFCDGVHPVWVEVKTLDLAKESQVFERAWDDLRRRAEKVKGFGEAHALIGPAFDDQASAALMDCVSRELRRTSAAPIRIVAVPADPESRRWARLTYSCDGSAVEQVGPASASRSYPCYPSCEPDWSRPAKLTLSDGTTREDHAHRILNVSAGKVALRLFESQTPFKIASASMFEATRNRSNQRVRDAIDEANDQIRNGQTYRCAPGVVCVYQETLDALGGHTLLSAIFGDLTVPIDRDSKKMGEAFLGRNGILNRDQNRGISAVCYTGYGGNSTFIVNPWADYPVEWQLFAAEAYVMQGSHVSLCRRD